MSNRQFLDSQVENSVPDYISQLTRTPLLTSEEEVVLTRASQAGDLKAKGRLIEANMRLVINIAKNYKCKTIPLEDLIQEGAIGLMQAADRFDPARGFRFSTYATHWIRQAIGRAVDNKSKTIRIPAHAAQTGRQVERLKAIFSQLNGREPSTEELSKLAGLSEVKLKLVLACSEETVSLDTPLGDRFGTTLCSLLQDKDASSPEDFAVQAAVSAEIQGAVDALNERERLVIKLKYCGNGSEMAIDQIAAALSLTKNRVRLIEISAIKKLRMIANERRLADLI